MGSVGILNVGAGDTKLTFDKNNPAERIRAARIVKDMLRRGYALLVDKGDGVHVRATDFDENTCEYIIADFDPSASEEAVQMPAPRIELREEADGAGGKTEQGEAGAPAAEGGPARRGRKRRIKAEHTNAVAVARTAGG